MSLQAKSSGTINTLKLYIFPSIVTILAMMIWRDVSELRSDVKQLLAESASNKAKVERLERQVDQLNQAVFKMPKTAGNIPEPWDKNNSDILHSYAVLNKDDYFYVRKQLPYKTK
jgi:hypothetical protein